MSKLKTQVMSRLMLLFLVGTLMLLPVLPAVTMVDQPVSVADSSGDGGGSDENDNGNDPHAEPDCNTGVCKVGLG